MFWFLLIAALVLIALGVDALDLARYAEVPTDKELDEMILGKDRPPLSQAAHRYFRSQHVMSTSTRFSYIYGIAFIAAGLFCIVLAFGAYFSV